MTLRPSIRRCLSDDKQLLIVTIDATSLIQEILDRTQSFPPAMIHLGQATLATLMVQAMNDPYEDEIVELQWKVDGVFGDLSTYSGGFGKIRANIANPKYMTEKLDTTLGNGIFTCRKTKNSMSSSGFITSNGIVNLDIEDYFRQSEQKHCAVGISVKISFDKSLVNKDRPFFVELAKGYLIHFLPYETGVSDTQLLQIDRHLAQLGPLSQWVTDADPKMSTLTMAKFITGNFKVQELNETEPVFHCSCTRDKVIRALSLLTSGERNHLFEESKDNLEINCEFCGEKYTVSIHELNSFLA